MITVTEHEARKIAKSYDMDFSQSDMDRANEIAQRPHFEHQRSAFEYLHHWYGETSRVVKAENRQAIFDKFRIF